MIQFNRPWRDFLVYNRFAIENGEFWRIWTGQLVHFGWAQFVADSGLFVILGFLIARERPWIGRFTLIAMPIVIAGTLYWWDPTMVRYAGLSAINLGLLVFLACKGWQRNWFDWFWPSVLAIYVAEVVLETNVGHGHGGGMIQFDDPSVHVATSAHLGSAVFGVLLWCFTRVKDMGRLELKG
jgi:rhomboid family GlyGly-CTERM serine protease